MVNLLDIQKLFLVNNQSEEMYKLSVIKEKYKNSDWKNAYMDSMMKSIPDENKSHFAEVINYVIDNRLELILEREEFKTNLYEDEDDTEDLILPAVRKVFSMFFIEPPTLFKESFHPSTEMRMQLFQLLFDIDEFIDYLEEMFIKTKDCLKDFTYIDRTAETLKLIVDNYVAMNVSKVRFCSNLDEEIEKLTKKKERGFKLEEILDKKK